MASLFFSYSHKDETLRDELETHLTMLKRQGVINVWHDRRLVAGDEFDGKISKYLEQADIILLLVSSDFLASGYCYDKEMKRAVERHDAGEARVIPVILRPCEWHQAPFGKLLATPTDGKAVTKFPNQDDAFLDITKAIREAAAHLPKQQVNRSSVKAPHGKPQRVAAAATAVRSSNLAIKKTFTDHDKDSYLDEAFEFIAKFFENSLAELQKRNQGITTRFKRIDTTRFSAHVYRDGKSIGECSIRMDGSFGGTKIAYSSDANATNSLNEAFSVANNGHSQYLTPMGLGTMHSASKREYSEEGAAEYLWAALIQPLQT
jgi:TIR domain